MNWLKKVKDGLSKTASGLTTSITRAVKAKKIDDLTLDELHEAFIMADFGPMVADEIMDVIRAQKIMPEQESVNELVSEKIASYFQGLEAPFAFEHNPHVLLLLGVNGNGKTTTAGKLAYKLRSQGKKVMIAACDTFRAAAVDQLKVWAERAEAEFVYGEENADAASVAYRAVERAKSGGYDVLIIDTAGRLHNKQNLMDELNKIIRVMKKIDENLPHDTVLVLDATTGQNALQQAATFKEMANINGIVMTKLDGTAKGGILVNLAAKHKMPIRAIGVGEGIDDLDAFDAKSFANAILSR